MISKRSLFHVRSYHCEVTRSEISYNTNHAVKPSSNFDTLILKKKKILFVDCLPAINSLKFIKG